MKRRAFLRFFALGTALSPMWMLLGKHAPKKEIFPTTPINTAKKTPDASTEKTTPQIASTQPTIVTETEVIETKPVTSITETNTPRIITQIQSIADKHVKDMLPPLKAHDKDYPDDIYVIGVEYDVLKSATRRLNRVKKIVGFGLFNLISFDSAIAVSKRFSEIGAFTKEELNFMEKVFFRDASEYGFMGKKVVTKMTYTINKKDTKKIPNTGHYLYKGPSLKLYAQVKKEVGESLILTSGIRSQIKQMNLFLAKAINTKGNLSRASRSLAPPGHSFHGSGDFDVGQIGLGSDNFTNKFAETKEYKKLTDLGYIKIRYFLGNRLGVRFEPWHIKVS